MTLKNDAEIVKPPFSMSSTRDGVFVEQERAAKHQLQIHLRMLVQLAQQELAAAVVGAARQREADSPCAVARLWSP